MAGIDPALVTELPFPMDPQLSPDGRRLAWTVTPFGVDGEHAESSLWVADLASGEPGRRWTWCTHETEPRWSPDGSRLAFLSDRKVRGTHGIYVIDVAGGEARPVVVRKRDIGAIAWSPDGTRLAFLAPDEPSDEDERREKEKDDVVVRGEFRQQTHLWLVGVDEGEATRLDDLDRTISDLVWSPSGDAIAVTSDLGPGGEHWTTRRVDVVPIDGVSRTLCAAPYGRGLAWLGDEILFCADHDLSPQTGTTAWAVPVAGGDLRLVGTGRDEPRCTEGLTVDAAGTRALLAVADGLESRFEWLDVATGEREVATRIEGQPFGASLAIGADGPVLATIVFDNHLTARVLAGPPDDLRDVVDHAADLPEVVLGIAEPFGATAPDGTHLDAVVIRPAADSGAGEGPWPTAVMVHGGPYGRDTCEVHLHPLEWSQLLATRGYAVVLPNYRGSSGRGRDFAAQAHGTMGGVEWDDVMAVTDAAIAAGIADPDRMGIGGWSQGGFLTAWAVTATDRFKVGVMGAGVSDWSMMASTSDLPDFEGVLAGSVPWDGPGPHRGALGSPISYASRRRTPLLILHGADDPRVPHSQAVGFHRALAAQPGDVPLEMVTYPRAGHAVMEKRHQVDLQQRVVEWFDRYVKEVDS